METVLHRGDVFYAKIDCGTGSEQRGNRPVVILQNDIGNQYSPTTIVAPVTTKGNRKRNLPTHCLISAAGGLEYDSAVLLEQIRTIDKQRLQGKIGHLSDEQMESLEHCTLISLGFIKPIVTKPLEMCLCKRCLENFCCSGDYRIKRKDKEQMVLDTCTYCNYRTGYDYVIYPKKIVYPKMRLVNTSNELQH